MKKLFLVINVCVLALIPSTSFAEQKGFTKYSECPILFESTGWVHNERWNDWERRMHWFGPGTFITGTGIGIYSDQSHSSHAIQSNPSTPYILTYIGPWKKVTLTETTHFWQEPKTTEVEIRLIASQNKRILNVDFETKDELNSKIPEQDFVLLEPASELIPICYIKWVSKYGYNAIADLHPNPWFPFFTREYLTGSGKIIDSETSKIIADETGKIVEAK